MDDQGRVAALRSRDPQGLADTYDAYGDALFAFCQAMLRDRGAAEDAVHDTFLIVVERIGQLRDPSRLRPWLYAIARTQCLRHLRAVRRTAPTDEVVDVMDESIDLGADLHSAQLRDLVWQAVEGLNTGERAAIELSLRHGLEGEDLAAALGVNRGTSNKLIQRAREELERGLAALLVTRDPSNDCGGLATIVQGWDGQLTILMRKRISRHIDGCEMCSGVKQHRVSAAALLSAIPLIGAPAALRSRVLEHHGMRLVSYDRTVVNAAGWFDHAGFPTGEPPRRNAIAAAAAVATLLVLLLIAVVAPAHTRGASFHALPLAPGTASTSAAPLTSDTPVGPSTSAKASRSASVTPGQASTTASPGQPTTTPTSSSPPRATSTAPARKTTSKPKPPPPPPVTFSVSPTKVDLSAGSQQITLQAMNGTVTWSAKLPADVTLDQTSGTVSPGSPVYLKVAKGPKAPTTGYEIITFTWSGGSQTVAVSWS